MNDILGVDDILGLVESGELSGEEAAAILGLDDSAVLGAADILGQEAILGMDTNADILGAALRARGGAAKKMLAKNIAARKLSGARILSPKAPISSGVQPIGFVQLAIAANTQALVNTPPQAWFKPMRLVVPGTIAPFFTIDNIIVGNKSQFPSPVPVPAEMFIPEAESVVMDLDTVNPGLNLTLQVTNISGVAQNFRAGFVGKQVTG